MRRMCVITAAALIFSLAVCFGARLFIDNTAREARHLRTEAADHVARGDFQAAQETMVRLSQHMKDRQPILEMLCGHEALHEIRAQLIEARACVDAGSDDDFYRAIYSFGEGIEQLAGAERLSLSNFC